MTDDDPAAQRGAGAQRVEDVEDVVELERGDGRLGEAPQAAAEARRGRGATAGGRRGRNVVMTSTVLHASGVKS